MELPSRHLAPSRIDLAADVAGPFDAGEGMDLHALRRCRSAHARRRARPSDGSPRRGRRRCRCGCRGWRWAPRPVPFDAAATGRTKIFGQLRRIGQDQVPRIVPRRQPGVRRQAGASAWPSPTARRSNRYCSLASVFPHDSRRQAPRRRRPARRRLGPSANARRPAAFTRASTSSRSSPERLRGSFTGQLVSRRQTSAR